jgi:ERCC4-type nuclease
MKIIVDEREHDLYMKLISIQESNTKPTGIHISKEVLHLGDIHIKTDDDKDILLIERKTFPDLLASIKDGRYDEQSYRLIHSSGIPVHNIIYLLEGMISQLRTQDKSLVFSTITSLNYFKGFSIMRTATVSESAEWILALTSKIERDMKKGKQACYSVMVSEVLDTIVVEEEEEENIAENEGDDAETTVSSITNVNTVVNQKGASNYCTVVKKVKKENVTSANIGEIVLCQIPGISSATAIAIMRQFTSFSDFFEKVKANPEVLKGIQLETNGKLRKINKSSIENIRKYLFI